MQLRQSILKREYIIPLIVIIILLIILFSSAIKSETEFQYQSGNPVEFGISIVEQNPSSVLEDLRNENNSGNLEAGSIASFRLQTSTPHRTNFS